MLEKSDIIELCRGLGFGKEDYCVGFGAAMVLHGIKKETRDVDMEVAPQLFERLCRKYPLSYCDDGEPFICLDGKVDIFSWSGREPKKNVIEGIPVFSLEYIIETKSKLGRSKDLKDIELIKSFMN